MSVQLELEVMHKQLQRQRLGYGEGLGGGGIAVNTIVSIVAWPLDSRGLVFRQCMADATLLTFVGIMLSSVKDELPCLLDLVKEIHFHECLQSSIRPEAVGFFAEVAGY